MSNSFEGSGCTASHIYILAATRSHILLRKHTVPYTRTGLPYPGKRLKIPFIRSSMKRSALFTTDSKQFGNRNTSWAHCFGYVNAVRSHRILIERIASQTPYAHPALDSRGRRVILKAAPTSSMELKVIQLLWFSQRELL
jgi:hypothetical protein